MAYKFRDWTLYKGLIDINEDTQIAKYFFSRWTPNKGEPSDLPEGYEVELNERTGIPFIKDPDYF
jgi:hypothetical protein